MEEIKLIVGALKIFHVIIYDYGPNWAPLSHITQLHFMAKKRLYNSFCIRISDHWWCQGMCIMNKKKKKKRDLQKIWKKSWILHAEMCMNTCTIPMFLLHQLLNIISLLHRMWSPLVQGRNWSVNTAQLFSIMLVNLNGWRQSR